jgi:integrase
MTGKAGIGHWHAHEGRHTAVSIMSSNGVPIQDISDTVGHKSTHVPETVYRHVIVPAIRDGDGRNLRRRRQRRSPDGMGVIVTWNVTEIEHTPAGQ